MTEKHIREYAALYLPYSKSAQWVNWFVKIAPVKAKRNVKVLQKYKKNGKYLLDFGCGIGFNLYFLAKEYEMTYGVDVDPEAIAMAKQQLKKLGCPARLTFCKGEKLPFKDRYFDIVISNDVWEHADDPQSMLREASRILKKDGILLINTPNKLWPLETHYKLPFLSYLPAGIADAYVRFLRKVPQYRDIHLPTYKTFRTSVEEFFTVQDITLDLLLDYKDYALDKERGGIVPVAHAVLKTLDRLQKIPGGKKLRNTAYAFFVQLSVGWVFIATPKRLHETH